MEPTTPWGKIILFLIIGLILGGGAGYYVGMLLGKTAGVNEATAQFEAQQEEDSTGGVAGEVQFVNPLEESEENPLEEVQTNPFE